MSPKLELKGVVKRFGDRPAVRGLWLGVERGEFLSLLGPSGCGKSTTLAMVAGFVAPDEGEILVDGRPVGSLPPQKRRLGLVFQDYAVFTRLTVAANLGFGLAARGVRRRARRAAVAAMAERMGLTSILGRRGASLNMSEMQRVALARVLLTEPELLLLDEPMSNLDAAVRAGLRGELKQVQRELGQTVLYVTHDQAEAMAMSDRIAVMRDGAIVQLGTPQDIYDRPVDRFVAEFIGDPPMNVLPCEVQASGAGLAASTALHAAVPLGRGAVAPGRHWLGVRPHDLRVTRAPAVGAAPCVVRFVENFGAEHVLHVGYGEELLRIVVPPGLAGEGDTVHVALDPRRLLLIDRESGRVVPLERAEAAA
ncbi:MAG: ABC transporter ATP-binding protein [Rhodospirillaceae bacterium]|nr:ABC transporter ATP-binding protein [Rhodospirillaceae bacterium]